MTKITMTIDTDDWETGYEDDYGYEKGETFERFIRRGVISHIGDHLIRGIDKVEKETMVECGNVIRKKAIKNLDRRIGKEVTKVLHGKLQFKGASDTLPDAILQAIEEWRTTKDTNSYSRGNKVKSLKEMINETIYVELSKETKKVLDDVKSTAVKQAQAKIAQIISIKLFDGENLIENSLKG